MRTRFNIYRYPVGNSPFCDVMCLLAARLNGMEENYTIKQLHDCAQMELMMHRESRFPITIEQIGNDILHIDKWNEEGKCQTFFRAELVEVVECTEASKLTNEQARNFVSQNPEIGISDIPTLYTHNPKNN